MDNQFERYVDSYLIRKKVRSISSKQCTENMHNIHSDEWPVTTD